MGELAILSKNPSRTSRARNQFQEKTAKMIVDGRLVALHSIWVVLVAPHIYSSSIFSAFVRPTVAIAADESDKNDMNRT